MGSRTGVANSAGIAGTKKHGRVAIRDAPVLPVISSSLRLVILVVVAGEEAVRVAAAQTLDVQHLRVLLAIDGHRHEVITRAHHRRAAATEAAKPTAAARCTEELGDVAELRLVDTL